MEKPGDDRAQPDWLAAELADTLDEDYELELSEPALSMEIREIYSETHPPSMPHAEEQVAQFFRDVPEFERMLVRSGIRLVKYWFSITDEEQQMRFLVRIHDPLKQWKLSPMDLQSRVRWEAYTKAKEETFARTNIPEAPWYIVEANDKKRARLNCIDHLLSLVPYEDVPHQDITLPERVFNPEYERKVLPPELYVPSKY
jgi:hypothetical protein